MTRHFIKSRDHEKIVCLFVSTFYKDPLAQIVQPND